MRTLTLDQVLRLHARVIETSGGGAGLRDLGRLHQRLLSLRLVTMARTSIQTWYQRRQPWRSP